MLFIENLGIWRLHSKHLEISNSELLLGLRNYGADVHVTVGLDHSIGLVADRLSQESLFGKIIAELYDFELPAVAGDNITNIQILKFDVGVFDFL